MLLRFAAGAIAAAGLVHSASGEPLRVLSQEPARQMATDELVLHSAQMGRDFLIQVTHPFGKPEPGKLYPAIYALDGGYSIAGPMGWVMGGGGAMERAFIISVGYRPDSYAMRDQDLLFRPIEDRGRTIGGGGAAFEAFLVDELEPFIAGRYAVDPSRTMLFGHSEGGLFALHVLLDRPHGFAGYIICSPSLWQEPDLLARLSSARPAAGRPSVFVGVGEHEEPRMTDAARAVSAALSQSFAVTSRTFAGSTHLAYYPMAIVEAFPNLLPSSP